METGAVPHICAMIFSFCEKWTNVRRENIQIWQSNHFFDDYCTVCYAMPYACQTYIQSTYEYLINLVSIDKSSCVMCTVWTLHTIFAFTNYFVVTHTNRVRSFFRIWEGAGMTDAIIQ